MTYWDANFAVALLTTRPWLERLTDVATVVAATTPDASPKRVANAFGNALMRCGSAR